MKHIGGFFELEPGGPERVGVHSSAEALHTGRACLMVMLSALKPRRVYVPYYTCDALLQPFEAQNIATEFYAIDKNLFPIRLPTLRDGDYFLYINYFGLCEDNLRLMNARYGSRLLVDDTHSFFRGRREGLWSFTSARKYFGVPDGAYLYAPTPLTCQPLPFEGISTEHLVLRRKDQQEEAFAAYQKYEKSLDTSIFGISSFSRERLAKVDYLSVSETRRKNYRILHRDLGPTNSLKTEMNSSIPFCYPYLPHNPISHHEFYKQLIYPPMLWGDVTKRDAPDWEQALSKNILPFPLDHRYGMEDMRKIIEIVELSDG